MSAIGVLATPHAFAQVRGVVQDPTGAAVSGAEVTLRSGSERRTATTNSDGRFSVQAGDLTSAIVEVQASGFGMISQPWSSGQGELVLVLPLGNVASSITVTARTPVVMSDATAAVNVLSGEEFANSGAFALDDALRRVPGFSLFRRSGSRTSNPTAQGVSMRGVGASGASRALVLLDSVPLNDPFGGWVYWSRVPRSAVERVEVSRGGASALYGSDALGGVVSVQTPLFDSYALSAETFVGSQESPMASLTGSVGWDKWSARFSGEGFRTEGYIPLEEASRGPADDVTNSEHGAGSLRIGRTIGEQGRFFLDGSMFGESRKNGTVVQKNSTTIRQLSTGLDWTSAEAGAIALRLFGGTQNYRQNFTAVSANRATETMSRDQSVPVYQIGGSAVWSRTFHNHQIVVGTDIREIEGETDEFGFFNGNATSRLHAGGRQSTAGVFFEDLFRITPNWIFTGSARVDHWRNRDARSVLTPFATNIPNLTPYPDRSESAFSPRLGLLRRVNQYVTLSVSGYRAFRAPTLNELYRGFRVGNVQTNANENLRAERVTGAEATMTTQSLSGRLEFRSTYFWSRIYRPVGNITLSTTPALITRQRRNIGRTHSQGVELDGRFRVNARTSFGMGYQFADAKVDQFPGNTALEGLLLPQVPRHQFTMDFFYSNPRMITVGLQGRYLGQQFDDDVNQFPLERFFNMDASVSRAVRPGVEVFAAAENLFNSRYSIGRTPIRTIAAPIFARVGVRFQIGEGRTRP
ncbi:MAG: TonB-dependent receptor [Thermomicrobiales bacterium]